MRIASTCITVCEWPYLKRGAMLIANRNSLGVLCVSNLAYKQSFSVGIFLFI
jgi:hypothetical protein